MKTHRHLWPVVAALALLIGGCALFGRGAPAQSVDPETGIAISAVAGPVCPVERVPPDPACAPRPVANATILVVDDQGKTVATVTTGADGTVVVPLPGGKYVLQPQPIEGFMGGADPIHVSVFEGAMTPAVVTYDTGIR
jgi:hypothetical protein